MSPAIESAFATLSDGKLFVRRVHPVHSLPAGATIVMGGVDIKLARVKDQSSDSRQQRAQRIATLLETQLRGALPKAPESTPSTTADKLMVYARIVVASEGSRLARICCAELGFGYTKLVIQWVLVNGAGTVLLGENRSYKSTGACGFTDLCSSSVGDDALDKNVQVFVQDVRQYLDGEMQKSSKA